MGRAVVTHSEIRALLAAADKYEYLPSCEVRPAIAQLLDEVAETQRELERWKHGVQIEGDYVCPTSLERDSLRSRAENAERLLNEWPAAKRIEDATADTIAGQCVLVDAPHLTEVAPADLAAIAQDALGKVERP